MKRLLSLMAAVLLFGSIGEAKAGPITTDLPTSVYITVGNLDWAWASPVATLNFGSNTLELPGFHSGWRYATDLELANRPDASDFLTIPGDTGSVKIATPYWNSNFTHVDYGDGVSGFVTSVPNNTIFETWYVRDVASSAVPEPATMTMLGIGVAGMFGYGLRRRRANTEATLA